MDELIARLTATAGIDAATAKKAVGMILAFLQREAPASSLEPFMNAVPGGREAAAEAAGQNGGLMGSVMGGMGVMGLGTQLMGAGLSMDQIKSVSRTLFEFGREKAGEDAMGEVVAAVPGLSQFV